MIYFRKGPQWIPVQSFIQSTDIYGAPTMRKPCPRSPGLCCSSSAVRAHQRHLGSLLQCRFWSKKPGVDTGGSAILWASWRCSRTTLEKLDSKGSALSRTKLDSLLRNIRGSPQAPWGCPVPFSSWAVFHPWSPDNADPFLPVLLAA